MRIFSFPVEQVNGGRSFLEEGTVQVRHISETQRAVLGLWFGRFLEVKKLWALKENMSRVILKRGWMLSCTMGFRPYITITHVSASHGQPNFPPASAPISTTARPVCTLRRSRGFQLAKWVSTFSCIVLWSCDESIHDQWWCKSPSSYV